jgi:uncharacterized membrane-anchored protein YitT (DUF2179 family)
MKKEDFKDLLMITIGVFLLAMSVSIFFERQEIIIGGVTGLAIIIQYWTEGSAVQIPIWLTNLIVNIALFAFGVKVKGMKFMLKTMYAVVALSVFLYFTSGLMAYRENSIDMINSAIFGGILAGVGIGITIKNNGTTGGTVLIAAIINKFSKNIPLPTIILTLDAIVILIGLFVFGPNNSMYGIIAIFTMSRVITLVQVGIYFNKSVMIISDKYEEIAKALLEEYGHGVTSLVGKGMYTNTEKEVLICVVPAKNVYKIIEKIEKIDDNAFIILSDAKEVIGNGFKK